MLMVTNIPDNLFVVLHFESMIFNFFSIHPYLLTKLVCRIFFQQKMWRKSRRPISFSKFVGVDFNRNFSVGWEKASPKTSSYTYRGEKPFSEPETRIIQHLMHSLKPMFYLTLHSFHKSIMFPYGFTR